MTASEIRQQFLDFFKSKEHAIVPSSAVVPHDDPTLLFTNAGMNQFKDVFLGTGDRPYARAADTQKCIRAGGKHNDLDDVGHDTYHHTFFEMLGNWSFGNYFKREAIAWAWELLTEVWGIDKSRLHVTYFEGDPNEGLEADEEAARLWAEVTDIAQDHIHPGDKKDNFWEMGETGPCGPCSEIHIDLTEDKSGGSLVNKSDKVIEIWNLVFIQFNRSNDGKLSPLPAKHVDTGMGFERICAVLQNKKSNYDTDVWTPIFGAISERTGAAEYKGTLPQHQVGGSADPQMMIDVSYRVIADHLRCLTFAITDGAVPSNERRGYVLRRILRRAVRYGRQYLDMHEPFMCDLVEPLVKHMEGAFPELRSANNGKNIEHVSGILRDEEQSFGRTLDRGIHLFNDAADLAVEQHEGRISGADAFRLHDTFGFPIDLTELMAEERGLTVDIAEYERLMEQAREQARSAGGEEGGFDMNIAQVLPPTDDLPKYTAERHSSSLLGYIEDGKYTDHGQVPTHKQIALVLESTCFYGEQGGQVGDRGRIDPGFEVTDTKRFGETILHIGQLGEGVCLKTGDSVTAHVDGTRRWPTMQNHTATHLLNWALREVLGDGVEQKGSLVDAEKTRFDFSHNKPLTAEEVDRIQALVNEQIEAKQEIHTADTDQAEAREINTLRAVFGEKYPDRVRVVAVGADVGDLLGNSKDTKWMGHAVEFCGGTHLSNSGDVERFVLVQEEGVAKGVRRLVGITGPNAREAEETGEAYIEQARNLGHLDPATLGEVLALLQKDLAEATVPLHDRHVIREQVADLQKRLKKAQKEEAAQSGGAVKEKVADLLGSASTASGVTIVVGEIPPADKEAGRSAVDWIRSKTESSAVLLATVDEGKVSLIAGMSKDAVERGLRAGDLIKEVAPLVGGRGGGRPDMAQGGGTDPSKLAEALAEAKCWIESKLG